ncbi:MAG: minor capsid protein [Oscillospiraceae bacterium]|nr:minor capsid protein [Oscillospiraceae bacterium]
MMTIKINAKLDKLKAKSPELKAKAVTYISNELLKKCDAYIPFDTGMMRDSGISHSVTEQGKLVWKTPYVKKQWLYGKSNGLRGKQWALRAWNDYRKLILKNAQKIANGE